MNAREALRIGLPWRAGWLFNASIAWLRHHVASPATRLRALNTPGDLAPLETPPTWTFHLGLAARPTRPVCAVWADAFIIEFSWDGRVCQALAVMVSPGVFLGTTDAPVVPTLFSATYEVRRSGHAEWITIGNQQVILLRHSTENGVRFVLAVGHETHQAVMARAQSALDASVQSVFEESMRRREQAYERLQNTPFGTDALCIEALESLIARIERPSAQLPFAWCATEWRPPAHFDVDATFALTAAWSVLEPTLAEDMIHAIFALQRYDGAVPCRLIAGGSADYSRPPVPLLGQAIKRIAQETGHRNFVRSVWPSFQSYLSWTLEHFRSEFSVSTESATPETEETRGALALMLLAEIHAAQELGEMASLSVESFLWSEAERIIAFLERHPWMQWAALNAAHTRSEFRGYRPNPRILLALKCPSLPPQFSETVRRRWENHLHEIGDPAAHLSWTDLVVLLNTLQESEAYTEATKLAALIWRSAQSATLPQASGAGSGQSPASLAKSGPLDAGLAAAVIYASAPETGTPNHARGPSRGLLQWAERHHAAAMAALLLIPLVAWLVPVAASLRKKTPPSVEVEASIGLAQHLYHVGRYEDAMAIYKALARKGASAGWLNVMLGNAYFRSGDLESAEKCFRSALERGQDVPQAMLNLALTLYRKGQYEESYRLYVQFVDEYGAQYPVAGERARTAIHLLRQRMTNTTFATSNRSLM